MVKLPVGKVAHHIVSKLTYYNHSYTICFPPLNYYKDLLSDDDLIKQKVRAYNIFLTLNY